MTPEQACSYLGMQWSKTGNGPDTWNCWNFLCHVQRIYFGKELPVVDLDSREVCRAAYDHHMKSGKWLRVYEPMHGDVVSMREGDWPHVGVYLDIDDGKVLHCCEDHGVIATRVNQLPAMRLGKVKYYRIMNND